MPQVEYMIPVSIIKEGDSFVAYSPAIDISTVGDTFEEAQKMFGEASQLFFEEIMEKGTTEEALLELGWQKNEESFFPPTVVSHDLMSILVANRAYA
ncbi:MAG: hypothetical protein COU69_01270 [Candidatus Pacebacteria bacterium CG10_big_fil_rev_8_21_14_0_10_56_10]|nr:MAG: hypothetical protein COU69_01270 [Candidatus Pacebacteria bacterium CG10_big_fil_rev_8_21_14_0_10_56_10]